MQSKSWSFPGQLLVPMNAGAKPVRSIEKECLDRVIPLGEAHLRELIREYVAHYQVDRPHQGLDRKLIQPANDHAANGPLVKRERLGGVLDYCCREAG